MGQNEIREELVKMLNNALELEHAAAIQYLAHAELIKGLCSEKIIERLKEIASDEIKHADKFRNLIGNYLYAEPSMGVSERHEARETNQILEVNLKDEKVAIDLYKKIYRKIIDNKDALQDIFETLEHEVRHIIVGEQEHVSELTTLLG